MAMLVSRCQKRGLHPDELWGFIALESVPTWTLTCGGAGGATKLIKPRSKRSKTVGISGPQTMAGQIEQVVQYFQDTWL
jgi:hypothetical protein